MEKFSELVYERPDLEAVQAELREYIEALGKAASYAELRRLFLERRAKDANWSTMRTVAHIRNTADTRDPFYAEEMKYFHRELPRITLLNKEAERVILDSLYREELEAEFGPVLIRDMEVCQKLSDESVVEDMVEEAGLCQEYSRVSSTASTVFRGKTCNFYGLLGAMQSTDRQERKEAMFAWGDLYQETSGQLDEIYSRMVKLRAGMARKLGFDSYTEYAYLNRGRYDYNAADAESFRRQVKEYVVPFCARLREKQAERLGVDRLRYYDESLIFPEGNAVPQGDQQELVKKAARMYHELSEETGEFFDFMMEHELFDLPTRPGKRPGGYCSFLQAYKAPFIFSNFNGTSADVDVLTHEAGHAFEAYTASRLVALPEFTTPGAEVAEIHSMTMEHFAYPYMELFFGEQADRYRYAHLMDALEVIPYMVSVDEFQHRVYAQPDMTAAERRQVWHELEKTYLPWRDYDGHPFLEEGGFWMQKQHIFLYPFYYIEYALAQMGAFEFYGRMKKDRKEAWEDYYRLCQAGGSLGYFALLKLAHLSNPFEEGTVEKIVRSLEEDLL